MTGWLLFICIVGCISAIWSTVTYQPERHAGSTLFGLLIVGASLWGWWHWTQEIAIPEAFWAFTIPVMLSVVLGFFLALVRD